MDILRTESILNILNFCVSKAVFLKKSQELKILERIRREIYRAEYDYDKLLKEILEINSSMNIYE